MKRDWYNRHLNFHCYYLNVTFKTLGPVSRLIDEGKLAIILTVHPEVGGISVLLKEPGVTR